MSLAVAARLLSYVVPSEGLLVLFGVLLLGLAQSMIGAYALVGPFVIGRTLVL